MLDSVTEEIISAYVDGEVTDRERSRVEQLLAESDEARQLLTELKENQAALRLVQPLRLPADFHQRVLDDIAGRSPAPASRGMPPATSGVWRRLARHPRLIAASGLAAILLVALTVALRPGTTPDVAEVERANQVRQETAEELPDDQTFASTYPRPRPERRHILVFDLAITPKGRDELAFAKTLKRVGIAFDPELPGATLNPELEEELLASRFVEGVERADEGADPEVGKRNAEFEQYDVIEMVYVQGTGEQIDSMYRSLVEHPDVAIRLDFAIDPSDQGLLYDVGERAWALATRDAPQDPYSRAYRLNLRFELHSGPRTLARFPTPSLQAELVPDEPGNIPDFPGFSLPLKFGKNEEPSAAEPPSGLGESPEKVSAAAVEPRDDIYEVLVIRRNLLRELPAESD